MKFAIKKNKTKIGSYYTKRKNSTVIWREKLSKNFDGKKIGFLFCLSKIACSLTVWKAMISQSQFENPRDASGLRLSEISWMQRASISLKREVVRNNWNMFVLAVSTFGQRRMSESVLLCRCGGYLRVSTNRQWVPRMALLPVCSSR